MKHVYQSPPPPSECLPFLDMGRFEITRGRQALELRSNLSERRSLTDPIRTPEHCSASSSARNLQWAVAHGNLLFARVRFEVNQSDVENLIPVSSQCSHRAFACSLTAG